MDNRCNDGACGCGQPANHGRVGLCTSCYKKIRKEKWNENEQIRLNADPDRHRNRQSYCKKMHREKYREQKLVPIRVCKCGESAIKGSSLLLCTNCYKKHHSKNKIEYQTKRKKNHLPTRIRENIKSRLKKSIGTKSKSVVEHLGCAMDEYITYLESKWQLGMSWSNYGNGWHIDHIVPLGTNYDNLLLHHYSNTQPLWKKDHIVKTSQDRVIYGIG